MRAPFETFMATYTWRAILATTVLVVGLGAAMAVQQRGLERGVPNPIISYERAGTAERSLEIRSMWERNGQLTRAWWNTWLDFLFLTGYTAFAVSLLSWSASALRGVPWATAGSAVLAWVALLPGILDVAENVILLRLIAFEGLADNTLPAAAYWLATTKFGLGAVLLVAGVPLVVWASIRSVRR